LQNVALALFLAGHVLGAPALIVPAVLYVLVMNAAALGLVAYGRSREAAAFAWRQNRLP
jgi:BASS family bile acid:Na+ symporter